MESWQRLDRASADEAHELLATCCGSSRWADRMLTRRPFGSRVGLLTAAREEWEALDPRDWQEAFAAHPRIGDREALAARFPSTHELSTREQAGVAGAGDDLLEALAAGNRRYEEQFGYIFIVCASGKSAGELFAILSTRLNNEPATELRVAAAEQLKITELRLQRL